MQAWVSQPCLQPCCLLPQLPFLPLAALAAPPNLTSSRPGCDGSPLHCTALLQPLKAYLAKFREAEKKALAANASGKTQAAQQPQADQ
jgi:hypothetical protein